MTQQHQRSGPAPFLTKTHEMVEEGETDDVISWGEMGKSFVVWKPVEFARDLLPARFKHNNFSSFVRQLNTYGFRKMVPDRWEFGNENFQRGEQRLLCEIRRRKAPHQVPSAKSNGQQPPASTTNSGGEVHSSASTSSPPPPSPSQQLSDENAKLRKDNKKLVTELAQTKQHCEELLGFLSKYVDVHSLNTSLLMQEAALLGMGAEGEENKEEEEIELEEEEEVEEEEEEEEEGKEECLKLFGVFLKGFEGEKNKCRRKKRGRCEEGHDVGGRPMKMGFGAAWMEMSCPGQGSSKVCN